MKQLDWAGVLNWDICHLVAVVDVVEVLSD
jgi:hypothetical protein